MAQFDNICSECYQREIPSCFESLLFTLPLVDGDYTVRFKNKFGRYLSKNVTVTGGEFSIDATEFPTGYFSPGGAVVTVEIYPLSDTSYCTAETYTVCDVSYNCMILKPVSMTGFEETSYPVICNCAGCDQPCLTVESVEELPDVRLCSRAIVRTITIEGFNVSIWDVVDGAWVMMAQVLENFVDGEIPLVEYSTTEGWSAVINNGDPVSGDGTVAFDPAEPYIDVTFINGSCNFTQPRIAQFCPDICLTVADKSELPDPPEGCEFALVQNLEIGTQELRQWNGVDTWVVIASIEAGFSGSEIDFVNYSLSGSWTATINGSPVSGDGTLEFDPNVSTLDVVFINGNCSYVMDQIVPPSEVLAFTYFMNRDLAANDTVQLLMFFSNIGQTGYIDWGDGSELETFDSGVSTSISTSHLFSNSGLNDIKVYSSNPVDIDGVGFNSGNPVDSNGGIDILFEASVSNITFVNINASSISTFPTLPTTLTTLVISDSLLTTADLTPYTSITTLTISESPLTSINLTGLVLQSLGLDNNPGLNTLIIPDYSSLMLLNIAFCNFSTASIEGFLDNCDLAGLGNGTLYADFQTPSAPIDPGYGSYLSLLAKNWDVSIDF